MSPTRSIPVPEFQSESRLRSRPLSGARGVRLALAGGGTGGHIVPGLHLLAQVRAQTRSGTGALDDLLWFTSGRAIESRVFAALPELIEGTHFERVALAIEPAGGGAPSRPQLLWHTPRAVARARSALIAHGSEVVLGLGGFTSLPVVLAARSLGIPVALLEINAAPGSATRWLERFAERVFHAWPATMPRSGANARHVRIGPPLAPQFRPRSTGVATARAREALGFAGDRPLLVVLGGSQGARALNEFVRAHAARFAARGVQVLHQTGSQAEPPASVSLAGYRALEYIDPITPALAAATVALSRGGASTLAEIAALGVPAVVVPYPHHGDQHQARNAAELGEGVRVVSEARLGLALCDELCDLCGDAGAAERARMSGALVSAVPLDAATRLWKELALLAERRRTRLRRT